MNLLKEQCLKCPICTMFFQFVIDRFNQGSFSGRILSAIVIRKFMLFLILVTSCNRVIHTT